MADQTSRGGKKEGAEKAPGASEQHQPVHQDQGKNEPSQRPPAGQPGGLKESTGKSREGHEDRGS